MKFQSRIVCVVCDVGVYKWQIVVKLDHMTRFVPTRRIDGGGRIKRLRTDELGLFSRNN